MRHKITTLEFINRAVKIHGDEYDYTLANYINKRIKIKIICKKHGVFEQFPYNHWNGNRCKKCTIIETSKLNRSSQDDFILKANTKHNNKYSYNLVNYVNSRTDVIVTCPIHGVFKQRPSHHISGTGCRLCGVEKQKNHKSLTTNEFIKRAIGIHDCKYDYSKCKYTNNLTPVDIICSKHGTFVQKPRDHLSGCNCPKCSKIISSYELELLTVLDDNNETCIHEDRTIIYPKELDIYIPNKNIAIEICGLYWHGESKRKYKKYHLDKFEKCKAQGIKLITIFEDEWLYKKDIVISTVLHNIGVSSTKIHARKCDIGEISHAEYKKFLIKNHIQGSDNSPIRIGLFFNKKLISVMGISKPRFNNKFQYEIGRSCSELFHSVRGGFSKLLNYFKKTYNPISIISYADLRYGSGNSYNYGGFSLLRQSSPNYWYFKKGKLIRESRMKYQKHKLKHMNNYNQALTEYEIMKLNGYDRIWDCGNNVWVWTN